MLKKYHFNLIKKNLLRYSILLRYKRRGIKIIDNKWANNVKTSNRLFILGSGPSINDLSENDWSIIRRHDSVGFNCWWLHDFIPTFYVAQEIYDKNSSAFKNDIMTNAYLLRQEDYLNVPVVFRGSVVNEGTLEHCAFFMALYSTKTNNLVLSGELSWNAIARKARTKDDVREALELMRKTGWLRKGKITGQIPKAIASVTFIMALGCQMGYDEIILCGIDMNDSNHFYDGQQVEIVRTLRSEIETVNTHPHAHRKHGFGLSAKETIIELGKFLSKEDVKVTLQSRTSALWPYIEVSDVFLGAQQC